MSRRGPFGRWLLALPVAAATALPFNAGGAFDPAYNPHDHFRADGACPKCHLYAGGKPVRDRFTGDSTGHCLGCHSKEGLGRSHPIGARPRDRSRAMRVPAAFVLDEGGRMTCLTCHSAHGPYVATVRAYPNQRAENPDAPRGTPLYYKTNYVRRSDPGKGYAVLCDECHAAP